MTTRPGDPGASGDRSRDGPKTSGGAPGGRPIPSSPRRGAKIVLLVEEDADIRERLTRYVMRQDLIAMPVQDGAQALAVCETLAPDAVLLNLAVPDPPRLALIGLIKEQCAGAVLIVDLPASLASELDAECRENGADEILTGPIQLERLGAMLSRRLLLDAEQAG